MIGLQFVVITLIVERRDLANSGAISAFGTPTVVHFAGVLFVSAIMSAPWPSLAPLSVVLGIGGVTWDTVMHIVTTRPRDNQIASVSTRLAYPRVNAG